jgi:N-acetylglucosamine kinase-like BadF-type ATPase
LNWPNSGDSGWTLSDSGGGYRILFYAVDDFLKIIFVS